MPDSLTSDLIDKSVTGGDIFQYQGGGIINMILPYVWGAAPVFALPTELPPYYQTSVYSYPRDVVLRSTILHEPFWASAVAIAGAKQGSKSFDIKGDKPIVRQRAHQMMVQWGGDGYVQSQMRGVSDWLTTNNGEFWEIARSSSAAGSKVIGLVHLDSLRCRRTGDPDVPVIYYDLRGKPHEMRDYQIMTWVDMPDPSYPIEGIGHCAAERAYREIYKMSGIGTTINEKITGSGAHQIAIISGMSTKQVDDAARIARQQADAKGIQYVQGTIIIGVQGDLPPDIKTLQLRGLPENFDHKQELDIALLSYANAIGIVLTDLQPLSGQGLGTGVQTIIIEEKAAGRGLAARDKIITEMLNNWVLPLGTSFYFSERDTRDEQAKAQVSLTREQTRNSMILNGTLLPTEAKQMAADADDIPEEFVTVDVTPGKRVSDEQPTDEAGEDDTAAEPPATPEEMSPLDQRKLQREQPVPVVTKEAHEIAALLREAIAESKAARGVVA